MYSIDQLQAYVTSCNLGSFSAAAKKLGKAQSVISQHIMNLELDCGFELFDRSGKYPKLTTKGNELLPFAKATLAQFNRFNNKATQLCCEEITQLVFAIDEGIPIEKFSKIFPQLDQKYPLLQIEMLTASSPDIIDLVLTGRATTGIVFCEPNLPTNIDFLCLGAVSFSTYIAKHHPLADSSIAHLDTLKLYRQLVIRSKNSQFTHLNEAFSPDVWYADNYFTLMEMAEAGFGWCILPDHLVENASNKLIKLKNNVGCLTWDINIDVLQHQQFISEPLHQYVRSLLAEYAQFKK